MPCYRCHIRQTDPARGASPWSRAVIGGDQVLICPDCQREPNWRQAFDNCAACGSTRLTKALGLVVCRDCGIRADPARPAAGPTGAARPGAAPSNSSNGAVRDGAGTGTAGTPGMTGTVGAAGMAGVSGAAGAPVLGLPAGAIPSPAGEPEPDQVGDGQLGGIEPSPPAGSDLAADVEAALARVFGRGPGQTATADRRPREAGDR
ncbi:MULTISPECIES: hypothetical protein [unclassified Pseudofrankia]|uniref:hypothetical protein n=1 Tax=unclassified Pseudofrankia TaxID=2994372 RepID=UPI0018E38705|nr:MULTISPECIES: hypothetical protein [unclassified Pseudofrankia]MDT3438023.1 hypothetical protein [Pseudofrankia sp. BMG5.37]